MSFQLENWQEEALGLNAKERKIRQELEQMVTEILPVGVGALSWITLQLEIRGWGRFHNRRQVASYTGLCPGIHNSNGRGREGRINRCGNTIVRFTLIEMVWRLIRWQPEYPPIKKLRNALLSKRGKRRLIVAAARRLASTCGAWPPVGLPLKNLVCNSPNPSSSHRFGNGACTSSQLGAKIAR